MIQIGRSKPAMPTIISRRLMASRVSLAWMVVMLPSWPVFIAWSMSSVSGPRHSPTMIRSGRIRSAFLTRSRVVTSPVALDVARPGLHPDHVRLLEPQLGGVLDRRHPLVVGDEGREGVQQRRLAAAGAARDDDVDPGLDARPRGSRPSPA